MLKNSSHVDFKILYNNLLELVRKKELYIHYNIEDSFTARIFLIFFLASFLLIRLKKLSNSKKVSQDIFDGIFNYIELNTRELGFGDVYVNKKMKILTKSFYSILLECEKYEKTKHNDFVNFISLNFYSNKNQKKECSEKLAKFFNLFNDFSSKLTLENIKKGDIKFNYF